MLTESDAAKSTFTVIYFFLIFWKFNRIFNEFFFQFFVYFSTSKYFLFSKLFRFLKKEILKFFALTGSMECQHGIIGSRSNFVLHYKDIEEIGIWKKSKNFFVGSVSCKNRIRLLLLGREADVIVRSTSVEMEKENPDNVILTGQV